MDMLAALDHQPATDPDLAHGQLARSEDGAVEQRLAAAAPSLPAPSEDWKDVIPDGFKDCKNLREMLQSIAHLKLPTAEAVGDWLVAHKAANDKLAAQTDEIIRERTKTVYTALNAAK